MIGKIVDELLDTVPEGGFSSSFICDSGVLISRKRALSAIVGILGKQDDEENLPAIIAGRALVRAIYKTHLTILPLRK